MSLVAGGKVGKKKRLSVLQFTNFHVHQPLGYRMAVNYRYQEAFLIQNLHQQFTLSSALQYLLAPSALNIRLPQLLQIIITSSPRRGPRQNKKELGCACMNVRGSTSTLH